MKWLSDHNVNIEIRPSRSCSADTVLYAEMELGSKKYTYCELFGSLKVNLQRYLRSVVFNFKRIFEKYGLNS